MHVSICLFDLSVCHLTSKAVSGHAAVFVGDRKLPELKQVLTKAGIRSSLM